jgi:hypothetical protein
MAVIHSQGDHYYSGTTNVQETDRAVRRGTQEKSARDLVDVLGHDREVFFNVLVYFF